MISVLLVLAFAAPPELPIIVAEVSSQCALSSLAVYSSGVAHIQESNTCQAGSRRANCEPPQGHASGAAEVDRCH